MEAAISRLKELAATVAVDSKEARQWHLRSSLDDLPFEVAEQYWGLPYDEKYLLLSFGAFEPRQHEILALSTSEALSDDGKEAPAAFIHASLLKRNAWLTPLALSKLSGKGPLYLHYFFLKDNDGQPASVSHSSFKVYDASVRPRSMDNPANIDGVATRPHPGISPRDTPENKAVPHTAARLDPTSGARVGAVYEKLFLSFHGLTGAVLNCYPSGTVEANDYIAFNTHAPSDAYDYIGNQYQYVTELEDGTYWSRWIDVTKRCYKYVNSSFWVLDLDEACKWKIFYCRKNLTTGKWYIAGDVKGFEVYPAWMQNSVAHIGSKKLHEIAIPGAHDSGVFDVYAKGPNAPLCQAQNLSFTGQLEAGVRYFDCRLYVHKHVVKQNGIVVTHGEYFFCHGDYTTYTSLENMIHDMGNFLSANREIVVLDFSRFSGFTDDDYEDFFDMVTRDAKLAPLLANGAHLTETITDLMNNDHRLVLLSDQHGASWASGYHLYPSINIHAQWADTSRLSVLEPFLDKQVTDHANFNALWALQAQLTPIPVLETMYSAAHLCNPVTPKWILDNNWWDKVNVVFCDFVCGGGMIPTLIEANLRKFP